MLPDGQEQCHLGWSLLPIAGTAAGLGDGQTPGPRLPLATACPSLRSFGGLFTAGTALAALTGKELVGLTCRNPSISFQAKQGSRNAGNDGVLWQFVEWPLGGTLQTVMIQSGLEGKSRVTRGVDSLKA